MNGLRRVTAALLSCGVVLAVGGAARAALAPTDISGLQLWLDAADVTDGGTEPNDSDQLAAWVDKSTHGRSVSQGTPDHRPTYRTNQLNGLPVVTFDGSNDNLARGATAMVAREIFAVAMCASGGSGNDGLLGRGVDDDENIRLQDATSYKGNANTGGADFTRDGGTFSVNGVVTDDFIPDVAHIIHATASDDRTYDDFAIGDGRANDPWRPWNGFIAEIIIYDRVLTGFERSAIEEYLRNKWLPGGLVAHWEFDGDATDSAGSYDGTLTGDPTWEPAGNIGGAIVLDGTGDCVDVPDGLADFTGGFTVAVWAYPTAAGNWARFIDFGNGSASDNIVFTRNAGSDDLTLEVYTGGTSGGQVTAPGAIDLDQWQHFAATIDGSGNVVIYKNGVEIQTGTTDVPADVTRTENYIGESNWGADDFYEGQIDDLRIYDRALWAEEIADLAAGLDPGLVAHWKLDEAAGATQADDATGNGNHGTPVDGATSGSAGRIDGAWDFDGDDYIAVPDTVINYLEGTICGWVKLHGLTGGSQQLFGTNSGACRYYLFANSNGVVRGRIRDPEFGNQAIGVGEWHHIAVTWVKYGPGTVYVDGVERGSIPDVGNTSAPVNANMGSFNRQTDNANLNGLADDVRVYDRALTPAELQELFDRKNVKVSPASGLVTTEDAASPSHSATFEVVLGTAPTGDVTVDVSSSNTSEGVVDGATAGVLTLVFTPSDWDIPQTVTVTGVDDAAHDGHVPYTVDLATSSTDGDYDGAVRTASVINRDDEIGTNLVAWWRLDGDEGPPSISSTAPTTAVLGQAYVYNIDAFGLPGPVTLDVDIPSPSGDWLSLNSGTELSGTPSVAATTADITVTATNPLGFVTQVFQVTTADITFDGLLGTYYDNTGLTAPSSGQQVDPEIDFGDFPDPAGPGVSGTDNFSVRWTGIVKADYTETYTFETNSDDGVRLWVNGVQLVDNWTNHGNTLDSGTIDLTAGGVYDITLEFYQAGGGHTLELRWWSASITREIIPQSNLSSWSGATPPAAPVFGTPADLIAEDSIGDNDGTLTNMTGHEWRAGQVVGALEFDGTDDHVLVPDSTGISVTGDLTIAAWINATSWPGNASIVTKDSNASYRFRIQDSGGTLWLRLVDGAGNEAEQVSYSFSTGTWYHVAATADLGAGEVTFYVNGSQVGATQTTTRTSIVDSAGPLRIGTYDGSSQNFDGLLDEVRIYDRALSGAEVQGLYERGFTTVRPTYGLVTNEDPAAADHTATFEVWLNSEPSADVTILLSSSDEGEGTINGATGSVLTLTFTDSSGTSPWNTPQTVTITGSDDDVADADAAYTIVLSSTSSADASFDGLDVADVWLTNINDDTAGVTVTVVPGPGLTTGEDGTTDEFTVVLDSKPASAVTITVTSLDPSEGNFGGSATVTLTFDDTNWDGLQTVTVDGINDDVDDGNIDYAVSFTVASAGVEYDGFAVPDIAATNIDDDTAGITVSAASVLTTSEGGGIATFTVVLASEPTADVTIAIQSSAPDEGTLSAAVLTFTASGGTAWDTPQEVTVTGQDDDFGDGDIDYAVLFGRASSADGLYSGRQPADIAAINLDDEPVVTVAAASPDTTNEDGSIADASFTVSLSHNDPGTVTIHFTIGGAATRGAGADYQLYAGGVLVPDADDRFDITGGATSIDVTVRAVDDDFGEGDEAVTFAVVHAPDDATYRYSLSGAGQASSTIIDDEPVVSVVASAQLASEPAVPGEFTVTRSTAFRLGDAFDIHYTLSGTATVGADYVTSPPSPVTIPAGVASATVTVLPVDDRRQEGDETATLSIVRNGALGYTVGAPGAASVTIADDERPGIGGGTGCAAVPVPAGGAGAAWGLACLLAAALVRRRAARVGSRP